VETEEIINVIANKVNLDFFVAVIPQNGMQEKFKLLLMNLYCVNLFLAHTT